MENTELLTLVHLDDDDHAAAVKTARGSWHGKVREYYGAKDGSNIGTLREQEPTKIRVPAQYIGGFEIRPGDIVIRGYSAVATGAKKSDLIGRCGDAVTVASVADNTAGRMESHILLEGV